MAEIRFTLHADGSSDRALIPILTWLINFHRPAYPVQSSWADLGRLKHPPRNLQDRLAASLELYLCDLLFVHRDAEKEPRENRKAEIEDAMAIVKAQGFSSPFVCVIPVRMTEAWLVFDESAIRMASGNPSGVRKMKLPKLRSVEGTPNPKRVLQDLLKDASELRGRRLKKFEVPRLERVSELIADFSPLRELPAFQALEESLVETIKAAGW